MVGERPSKSDAGAGSVACGLDIADDEPRSHGDGDVALVLHEGPHISGRESLVGDAVVPDQVSRREWRPATRGLAHITLRIVPRRSAISRLSGSTPIRRATST